MPPIFALSFPDAGGVVAPPCGAARMNWLIAVVASSWPSGDVRAIRGRAAEREAGHVDASGVDVLRGRHLVDEVGEEEHVGVRARLALALDAGDVVVALQDLRVRDHEPELVSRLVEARRGDHVV